MEVKINREIRDYSEAVYFGLNLRQFIFSVLACGIAVGLYFLLKSFLGIETLSWVCIVGAVPFATLGFFKYHGMTAEKVMSDEYTDLWGELLGASGQIIQSGSSFIGTGMFAWPFEHDHNITSRFGTRVDPISGEVKTHGGTDIAAPLGTPILATADGVVVVATWNNTSGYYVRIKHDNTYSTLYAHCSVLYVTAGQEVKQGQVIADCGSTGYSTGPHLHFEVIQNVVRVDALNFYKQE